MTTQGEQVTPGVKARREYSGPKILQQGFRPFFLAAGLWAVLALALWLWEFRVGGVLPDYVAPILWHAHEMLFGYGSAVVTGFLLTAVPNWTGRLPVRGLPLAGLAALWLAGRISFSLAGPSWMVPAAIIEASYLFVLFGFLIREIVRGRNWRNLIVAGLVGGFAVANGLVHAEIQDIAGSADFGIRLGIGLFVMLISLIGGRVTPSFTTNWLKKQGIKSLPAPLGRADRVALGATAVAISGWVVMPYSTVSAMLILFAATAQAYRLSRWQGHRCFSEPLVWVLHAGYGWLVLGLFGLGVSILYDGFPQSAALHGLTVGMIGTMTLAVMTRASLGHSGSKLLADRVTSLIFVLIIGAGVVRVLAPVLGAAYPGFLMFSGALWIAAFGLFVLRYLPLWVGK